MSCPWAAGAEAKEPTMAYAGQLIENPRSGERITFRETAADTGGRLLVVDLELAPGGRMPAGLHVHPEQEERFEVVRGRMRFRMRGRRILVGPGQVVVVPPGVRHDWANAGDDPALVRVEIRPALAMERLSETAVALAREGRSFANGMPKPLDLALFVREFEREVQAAFPLVARQHRLTDVHRRRTLRTPSQRIQEVQGVHRGINQPAKAGHQPVLELSQVGGRDDLTREKWSRGSGMLRQRGLPRCHVITARRSVAR
jgi:quercetin dioxygenase-like cupin family protein